MKDHDLMNHEFNEPSNAQTSGGWTRVLRTRLFPIALIGIDLVAGMVLARRLELGRNVLLGFGSIALVLVGLSLMRGDHDTRRRHSLKGIQQRGLFQRTQRDVS
jgi:hypothetical protein